MEFGNCNEKWKYEKDGLEIFKDIKELSEKEFKEIAPR